MSEELQRALLGSLILSPALLESSDIVAADFPEGKYRTMFRAAAKLWEEQRAVDPVILAESLGGNGGAVFVTDLLGGMIKLQPDIFKDRLQELRRRRISTEIVRIGQDLATDHLKRGELDVEKLAQLKRLIGKQDELLHAGRSKIDLEAVLWTSQAIREMDVQVRGVVGNVIYENAINLLAAPGGKGKTTISYQVGSAIADGREIFGLPTIKKQVIVLDYENPLGLIKDRLERLGIANLYHWTLSAEWPPPRLDSDDWATLGALPKDSVIVIDSLRSSHSLDENSSQDMSVLLGRVKRLRDQGRTIVLLHHSPKGQGQERTYRGSGAISDLSDHTLTLCSARELTHEGASEDLEPEPGQIYFFGCSANGKSRYEKAHIYLTLSDTGTGFNLAEDPRSEAMRAIAEYIAGQGAGSNQSELIRWAKESGVGPKRRSTFISLLFKGEQQGLWHSHRSFHGAKTYEVPKRS